MVSVITPKIVQYAAEECRFQRSGELSVAWMVDAWRYAHRYRNQSIKLRDVLALGRLVEPGKNGNGLRKTRVAVKTQVERLPNPSDPVGFWIETTDEYDYKMEPQLVPYALDQLLVDQPPAGKASKVQAREFFRQYEEIHPFVDGNGRTGSLIHLWLLGRLDNPIHPPNLWDDPQRHRGTYPEIIVPR